MPLELDPSKLSWSPDTCGCKVDITREDTSRVGSDEYIFAEGPVPIDPKTGLEITSPWVLQSNGVIPKDGQLYWWVRRYRTIKKDSLGKTLFSKTHELSDVDIRPPGTRLRGTLREKCPGHQDFDDVVQTQRWRPSCGCSFSELYAGESKQNGYFGACNEVICGDHTERVVSGEIALEDLHDVVIAEVRASQPQEPEV